MWTVAIRFVRRWEKEQYVKLLCQPFSDDCSSDAFWPWRRKTVKESQITALRLKDKQRLFFVTWV